MGYIDLHVHSTESDGSYTPSEIVKYACEKGLKAIALTDHDTVNGIAEAMRAADYLPIKVYPGLELSTLYGDSEIHVLAYFIDYNNSALRTKLRGIKAASFDRNEKMCALLRRQGIDITMAKLSDSYHSAVMTRHHIARYLLANGYVSSISEAFDKYIGVTCPCFIPRYKPQFEEALRLIYSAGGTAVIAHPVKYDFTDDEYMDLFSYARALGVKGIEAIYSENTYRDEMKFRAMAKELGMVITGGTDFHGITKPDIDLGTGRGNLMISESILQDLIAAAERN